MYCGRGLSKVLLGVESNSKQKKKLFDQAYDGQLQKGRIKINLHENREFN